MKKININKGDRYGRLVVLREGDTIFSTRGNKIRKVWCLCDCGKEREVYLNGMRTGRTISCGCARTERLLKFLKENKPQVKHDMYYSREYRSWNMMKQRCNNTNNDKYHIYGGKGIKVCKRWNKFEYFFEDMGNRPEGTSLGRINGEGNYELSNCRWENPIEQANNTSRNRIIEYKGKSQSVASWGRELNTSDARIRSRLYAGWDPIRALTEPRSPKFN